MRDPIAELEKTRGGQRAARTIILVAPVGFLLAGVGLKLIFHLVP
jgi:hypothetical protein